MECEDYQYSLEFLILYIAKGNTLCLFAFSEQKARTTYDNILRYCDDPDVLDPIRFLREREVVHYQRFGEALRLLTDKLDSNKSSFLETQNGAPNMLYWYF